MIPGPDFTSDANFVAPCYILSVHAFFAYVPWMLLVDVDFLGDTSLRVASFKLCTSMYRRMRCFVQLLPLTVISFLLLPNCSADKE